MKDSEFDGLWKEKLESEKLDPIPDEEFEPAKEILPEEKGEILIKVVL